MRVFTLPKRSGGFRTIYAPDDGLKEHLQAFLPTLNRVQQADCSHAFRPSHSPVTAAEPHTNMAVTVSLDLSDFFDSCTVTLARTRNVPAAILTDGSAFRRADGAPYGLPDDRADDFAARQGLPTSPAIANLCARPLDDAILKMLRKAGHVVCTAGPNTETHTAAYTRYADDLSLSFRDDPGQASLLTLIARVSEAARRCGFAVNPRKTRIHRANAGRREVVGILVDDTLHASRRVRRRLRAALHQQRTLGQPDPRTMHQAAGLAEWCKLKPPLTDEQKAQRAARYAQAQLDRRWTQAARIARQDGLNEDAFSPAIGKAKTWRSETLAPGIRITVDPLEFIKMGNVRYPESGGFSCMKRRGGYYHGVAWWAACPGIALGVVDGTPHEYRARVVLYHLRDNRRVYGRVYGNRRADRLALTDALEAAGIERLNPSQDSGSDVMGNVDSGIPTPYFDFGHAVTVRMTNGAQRRKLVI